MLRIWVWVLHQTFGTHTLRFVMSIFVLATPLTPHEHHTHSRSATCGDGAGKVFFASASQPASVVRATTFLSSVVAVVRSHSWSSLGWAGELIDCRARAARAACRRARLRFEDNRVHILIHILPCKKHSCGEWCTCSMWSKWVWTIIAFHFYDVRTDAMHTGGQAVCLVFGWFFVSNAKKCHCSCSENSLQLRYVGHESGS